MVEIREPRPRDDVDDVPLNLFNKLRHAKDGDQTVKHSMDILKVKFHHIWLSISGNVEEISLAWALNQTLISLLFYPF